MSKKEKQNETLQQEPVVEEQDVKQEAAAEPEETAVDPLLSELESLKDQVAGQEDKYLRLAAEYDNYRRRQREGIPVDRREGGHRRGLPPRVRQPGTGPETGHRRRGL